jgi:hypothetical protein
LKEKNTMTNSQLALPLVLASIVSVLTGTAGACDCLGIVDIPADLEAHDAVFQAELIERDLPSEGEASFCDSFAAEDRLSIFNLRVIAAWKGVTGTRVSVVSADNCGACGLEENPGDWVLIFARIDPGHGGLESSSCDSIRAERIDESVPQLDAVAARLVLEEGDDPRFPPAERCTPATRPGRLCGAGLAPAMLLSLAGTAAGLCDGRITRVRNRRSKG